MISLSTPNTISGRSAFIELLQSEGVTHLFGNPGTTELPIMHALADYPDMRYVLGLQEAIVVAMADGYARARRAGCVQRACRAGAWKRDGLIVHGVQFRHPADYHCRSAGAGA